MASSFNLDCEPQVITKHRISGASWVSFSPPDKTSGIKVSIKERKNNVAWSSSNNWLHVRRMFPFIVRLDIDARYGDLDLSKGHRLIVGLQKMNPLMGEPDVNPVCPRHLKDSQSPLHVFQSDTELIPGRIFPFLESITDITPLLCSNSIEMIFNEELRVNSSMNLTLGVACADTCRQEKNTHNSPLSAQHDIELVFSLEEYDPLDLGLPSLLFTTSIPLWCKSRITPTVLWRDYRRPSDVKNKSPITDSSPLFEPWNETWTDDRYQSKIRDLQHIINNLTQDGRRNHAVPITIRGPDQQELCQSNIMLCSGCAKFNQDKLPNL